MLISRRLSLTTSVKYKEFSICSATHTFSSLIIGVNEAGYSRENVNISYCFNELFLRVSQGQVAAGRRLKADSAT